MPVQMVAATDIVMVARCLHCGAARANQWETYSGGKNGTEPYKQCRSCGNKYVFLRDGTMRLVG